MKSLLGKISSNKFALTLCSATLGEDSKTEPPLGPLYVASTLQRLGIEVDFRDFQLQDGADCYSGDTLASFLTGHEDIVAISCFVDMLPAVVDATRYLYRKRPDTLFLLGGPGPTASARRILEKYHWIYGVVRGEGEETIADWVRLVRNGSIQPIPGMVYRGNGRVVDGGVRQRNKHIDHIPLPAYDLIDWSKYTHARIITTRGCAYRCSFCDVSELWNNLSIYRNLEDTLEEITLLRNKFGKSSVAIVDDTFVLNRSRVRTFCQMLLDQRVDIEWGCFGRINLMTPELIELMARAGCTAIFYGIDSGSQAVLDRTVKKVRVEDIMPVLKLSASYFDRVEASFIWGYPFETFQDFRMTLELAAEASYLAPVVNIQLHMLSPLPLSPIYKTYSKLLRKPDPQDRPWLLLPAILLDSRSSSIRTLIQNAPDIYPGFYSFYSPAKKRKRELLERSMRALDRTIGSTMLNSHTARLLTKGDESVERELIESQNHPADRIGVGLAVGFFRRARRRDAFHRGALPFEGTRGPYFVRERTHLNTYDA